MKKVLAAYIFAILLSCAVRAESQSAMITIDEALTEARKAINAAGLTEKEFPIDCVWLDRLPEEKNRLGSCLFITRKRAAFSLPSVLLRSDGSFPSINFKLRNHTRIPVSQRNSSLFSTWSTLNGGPFLGEDQKDGDDSHSVPRVAVGVFEGVAGVTVGGSEARGIVYHGVLPKIAIFDVGRVFGGEFVDNCLMELGLDFLGEIITSQIVQLLGIRL